MELIGPGILLVIAGLAITVRPGWLRQREIFRRGGDIWLQPPDLGPRPLQPLQSLIPGPPWVTRLVGVIACAIGLVLLVLGTVKLA